MPHNRFFIDAPLNKGDTVQLLDDEAHHLMRVMRIPAGAVVELVNGRCVLSIARVVKMDKKSVWLLVEEQHTIPYPSHPIILCQALPRFNRLEFIVEKGTELGMTELWLFPGDLSEKKTLSPNQLERLRSLAISALKQCGRGDLPLIILKTPLAVWPPQPLPAYFGDTSIDAPPFLSVLHKQEGALFFVGPESGFSSQEKKHLLAMGSQGVKLKPHILRTETAALAALTLLVNKI